MNTSISCRAFVSWFTLPCSRVNDTSIYSSTFGFVSKETGFQAIKEITIVLQRLNHVCAVR